MIKRAGMALFAMVLGMGAACPAYADTTEIGLNLDWHYADDSRINTGKAVLYTAEDAEAKGITVAVNAGHGTAGGESVKIPCHPDGSRKVTEGEGAAEGDTMGYAVSEGVAFTDGTGEEDAALELARLFAERLLEEGYDVLMIRDEEDVQLDNIARTVISNNKADCQIALHWDSTDTDKGVFYISTPDAMKSMDPVSGIWRKHEKLGESLLKGLKGQGLGVFSGGSLDMDLTQMAYSTIPFVDIELGDCASAHDEGMLARLAEGLVAGVNRYYNFP